MKLAHFHPQAFFAVLDNIDQESMSKAWEVGQRNRLLVALLVAATCLLFVNYVKNGSFFYAMIKQFSLWNGVSPRVIFQEMKGQQYYSIYPQAWWGLVNVIGYLLIPMACVKWVMKERLDDYGLQWGSVSEHKWWYVLLASPIMVFAILVSFRQDFSTHYPFYPLAYRSWVDLLLWECIYISQFVAIEFFFRGFLINILKPRLGSLSILVMCLPYVMIHFPKPWLESTGAILFGLFLGLLALRSRSIWGGVLVHVTIALTMDVAALLQGRGMPNVFVP
ncbi:MAG: CPBP family intramembrane metalloprotease [Pseudomonadales bacterium]|nr:CPBP family intramembrane metalloprotease [Pseudomonadales bacterium]